MSMPVISALDFTGDNMVDERIPDDTPIKNFYRSRTIFLTGGTGFLGQLFVEKLLRCKVKAIYVLARPKKNRTPKERIEETFAGVVFTRLKSIDLNYMQRIHLVEGDADKTDLGISNDQRSKIIDNVEIVIHAAADVRFDKSLQELTFTNVRGTKLLIALVKEIKNLIVFGYISTAYSQYHRECIEEKFYQPSIEPNDMIRIAEHFSESKTDELIWLTDKLIEPWANTYVFTKSLSEELVRILVNEVPTVVIRPSINTVEKPLRISPKGNYPCGIKVIGINLVVTRRKDVEYNYSVISTYEDPIPAWSNNVYGINGMIVGCGLGFIKTVMVSKYNENNVICADFVTNGTLASIWDKANEKSGLTQLSNIDEPKVIYNITGVDTTTNVRFFEELVNLFYKHPAYGIIWIPTLTFCSNTLSFFFLTILYHYIPATFYDLYFKLTNNNIRLMPMYRKCQEFLLRVGYFNTRKWVYDNNNMKTLIEKMSKDDKAFFPCDIFQFSLIDYLFTYMMGLRTYIAKEPLNNMEAAKRKFRILLVAHYLLLIIYYCFLFFLIYLVLHFTGYIYYLKNIYDNLSLRIY